ncbi:MAG: TatD family hydrolase, partial [Bergeyella zoohelcum]|nr:TatD family hydrolase [Bergeyella zoohelcum]
MFYFDFHHHQPCKNGIYNLNLFETPPNSPFSIGIHPKDIDGNFSEKMKWLEDYSLSENCVAIGECGLDALLETPLEQQEEA